MPSEKDPSDLLGKPLSFLIFWGIPIAAMVAVLGVPHPVKTLVWIVRWSGWALPV